MIEILTRTVVITATEERERQEQQRREEGQRREEQERHEARHGQSMRVPTVTQTAPDDEGCCSRIVRSEKGASPTREELEQDVMITNPSVESMESRG